MNVYRKEELLPEKESISQAKPIGKHQVWFSVLNNPDLD
jgi:hypothetical protein